MKEPQSSEAKGAIKGEKKEEKHAKTQSRRGLTENEIGAIVVDIAIRVHRRLGPGLFEKVYKVVMVYELREQGLGVEQEVLIPIEYRGIRFDEGFRADIVIEGKVILELKSVEEVRGAHKKQVLTYLRLTGCKLGYLLNFGAALMVEVGPALWRERQLHPRGNNLSSESKPIGTEACSSRPTPPAETSSRRGGTGPPRDGRHN